MTAIERTAYPRFKRNLTAKDLEEVYIPTPQERFLALRSTKGAVAEIGFLVLLKTHQRLGRFIPLREVPFAILNHISKIVDPSLSVSDLEMYDWKDLTLFRPDPDVHYTHLDSLFTNTIDWDLIETHLPDMIRVALSMWPTA